MLPWLEIILRTLVAVIALFALTKLLGKRQLGELSYFEYITGITLGSIAGAVSLDLEANWYYGIIAMTVWVGVVYALEMLTLKSKVARDFIDGKGEVLIKNGKVLEENLAKVHLTADNLLEQLRERNAFKVADVEFAVLEADGKLNVLLNAENQSLTAKHLGITVAPEQEPKTVIMDGKVLEEPLGAIGLNKQWLDAELRKMEVSLENVFLGQVDSNEKLTVDCYRDKIRYQKPS